MPSFDGIFLIPIMMTYRYSIRVFGYEKTFITKSLNLNIPFKKMG